MSGIEVAGVVLGVLPLIISAIEHYDSGLDRMTAFVKWKGELDKAMRELWIQHSYYEMTLRTLLGGVVTETELEEMITRPESELWKSRHLDRELRQKLGKAYQVYSFTITEMGGYMKTLAKHLDLDKTEASTADDLGAILEANPPVEGSLLHGTAKFEFRRRLKLTVKRSDIRRLLKDIKHCNERLDSFIEKADKFEQSVPQQQQQQQTTDSRRSPILSIPLQQIHSHAHHVHSMLSRAWTCSTHSSHRVHLLLEHRMMRTKRKIQMRSRIGGSGDGQESDPASFKLYFKDTDQSDTTPAYAAEVRVLEEPIPQPRSTSVTFQLSPPSIPGAGLDPSDTSSMETIHDLCSTFHTSGDLYFGLYLDTISQGILRGKDVAVHQPIHLTQSLITLEDILFTTRKWQPLTEEDRYILAITLAGSFLQLHDTPWIGSHWTAQDIFFCQDISIATQKSPVGKGTRVDVLHPLITKTYNVPAGDEASETLSLSPTVIDNGEPDLSIDSDDTVNLLALARLLLEIRSSRRIGDLRRKEDLGPGATPNEVTDLQTLKRWIEQEKGNLSFAFRGAITYCMMSFADPDSNLKDLGFRETVIGKVVAPLLEELHFLQEGRDG